MDDISNIFKVYILTIEYHNANDLYKPIVTGLVLVQKYTSCELRQLLTFLGKNPFYEKKKISNLPLTMKIFK